MRLCILCNHSFPHVGGSEKIVQQIAESMQKMGVQTTIFSGSSKSELFHNGVRITSVPLSFSAFVRELNKFDHIFVYSDYYHYWSDIVLYSKRIKPSKSIALVGMNFMLGNKEASKMCLYNFSLEHKNFKVLTHSSSYQDYLQCKKMNIPVTVIPNGVDQNEFNVNINFRNKFGLPDKKIILCVGNFFPGKGQSFLVNVLNKLKKKRDDYISIFISSTVNMPYAERLAGECEMLLKHLKISHKFFRNLSREDVVAAISAADVFAFPSQKEVSPLVLLECMTAGIPWVSFNVGNVNELKGGSIVKSRKNSNNEIILTEVEEHLFADKLDQILGDKDYSTLLSDEGIECAKTLFNWKDIEKKYYDFFFENK